MIFGALVNDNSPGISELSGATERVKEVVQDDEKALRPNCRAQHCAIALDCATENEQQNAGCK